jgi:hypothetical protein
MVANSWMESCDTHTHTVYNITKNAAGGDDDGGGCSKRCERNQN